MSIFGVGPALQLLKKAAGAGGQDCVLCGEASEDLVCLACEGRLPRCMPDWRIDLRGPLGSRKIEMNFREAPANAPRSRVAATPR